MRYACAARVDWPLRQSAVGAIGGKGANRDVLAQSLETLRASRPTAVNLMNNLDRMKQALAHEDFVPALVARRCA
jgi:methylthioribose-1-phosphate isomerase